MESISHYPWQQPQWAALQNRRRQNNVPHGLLFAGASGMGKLDFAKLFARNLLCELGADTEYYCNECRSCQLAAAGTHPDFKILQPEDTSRHIKIEQIRQLIEWTGKTAQQGCEKVIIIEPAETLNIFAANALLKTLEEPAARTVLILVSHRVKLLPATLKSRCQIFLFNTLLKQEITSWLTQECQTENPQWLLKLTDYRPLAARALLQQNGLAERSEWIAGLKSMIQGTMSPIDFAAYCAKQEAQKILSWFIHWIYDVIRLKMGLQDIIYQDAQDLLHKMSDASKLPRLFVYLDSLYETQRQLARQANFNLLLLFEGLLCSWPMLLA